MKELQQIEMCGAHWVAHGAVPNVAREYHTKSVERRIWT